MYDDKFALFVCAKSGLAPAATAGVEAVPPPHWVEQPGVVGETVTALVSVPVAVTTPVTVTVADSPTARFTPPATLLPVEPVVLHPPGGKSVHVTATEPTLDGTVSANEAVPGPVPVFLMVIV
jgi:hypothetical protein